MAWFMRGVQSAVFHYASCAPCTGYTDGRKRRRDAKHARKAREKLMLEEPDTYHHPEPTGTNPYWGEEIAMGPGPPPRRARRAGTGSTRCVTTAGTQSSAVSKVGSSIDGERKEDVRLSDDTVEDDNWNRKRYQREDEELWGHDEPPIPLQQTGTGSSVGVVGFQLRRPATSRSGSYYSVRAPPVNELHPPVVSLPSPDPSENRWMLQPPPKASVMAGKERATNMSRSHSGASSRVELSLGRQVSTRQLMQKLERRNTGDVPSISPASSYCNLTSAQRSRTPQARPPSAASSRRKRRDTAVSTKSTITRTSTHTSSANDSSDALARGSITTATTITHQPPLSKSTTNSDTKPLRAHTSRPALSTIVSSGSGIASPSLSPILHSPRGPTTSDENVLPEKPSPVHHRFPSDSIVYPPRLKGADHITALSTSDASTLNHLQDLVSPRALLDSRFVSAPLVEARVRLPPSEEDMAARVQRDASAQWSAERDTETETSDDDEEDDEETIRVPFDSFGAGRDVRLRWSVDF
ncbi:hypothetical protein T440DRAFT_165076 [Plenodomus tracheiphilus IPT5]|uniref:Uncharacterized protein n=1 Tax=Plenodomus tracheiphilus IPT5 TaxID=1408161 RepID=A0A6A7BN37_9PLEO|nr:hypothetical protein T440DRAFT_165076 [Plenodomus tracheiphilus IPT5]